MQMHSNQYLEILHISLKLLDLLLVMLEAFVADRSRLLAEALLQSSNHISLRLDDTDVLVHEVLIFCIPADRCALSWHWQTCPEIMLVKMPPHTRHSQTGLYTMDMSLSRSLWALD